MPFLSFRYHPNVQAVACLLRCLKVNVHTHSIDQQLEHHPDWPSLLCISDALHHWNVPHLAAKAADKQLPPDARYPFLAVTNHPERPLTIVTRVDAGSIHYYQDSYSKLSTEALTSFVPRWTGVYLLAEPVAQSGQPDYITAGKKWMAAQLLPLLTALFIAGLLTALSWPRMAAAGSTAALAATVSLYVLYAAGLAISCLLLWYEIDKRNPLLQKVCTGLAKTNCNAILNGKASKLFSWLSWSDIGFGYFAGGLLLFMVPPAQAPWAMLWLSWLGLAALAYPVFSIYYQWRVAKQWCMLCLSVQAILLLQALTIISHPAFSLSIDTFRQLSSAPGFWPSAFSFLLLSYLLPLLAWLSLKPLLLRWQTARQELRAYRRLKFNPEVFTGLLQRQKAMATAPEGLGIVLGPADAPHKLVKVCNPYCGPCSKAHPKIEKLLHQHSNLQVQILFMVPDEPGQRLHTAASHLMAIAQTATTQAQVQQALDHWYLPATKNYEVFSAKYPMNGELTGQANEIKAMDQWCTANHITYTPTIFFNGYELPADYDPEDLQYFLQE